MTVKARSLQVYEELSVWYDRQGQAKLRDWFLVLAADAALALGQVDQAERLRLRLLYFNPHHLLRPFGSFAEALRSPDVQNYIADLRRNYSPEAAEQLLHANQSKKAEEPGEASAEERELKVYRGLETPQENAPAPRARPAQARPEPSAPAAPAAPAPRMPTPVAWTRSASPPARAKPAPPAGVDEEKPSAFSYWLSSLLFVGTLLLAVGLAAHVLVGPLIHP